MKRLSSVMVVLMLAACSGESDNQEQEEMNEEENTQVAENEESSQETEESEETTEDGSEDTEDQTSEADNNQEENENDSDTTTEETDDETDTEQAESEDNESVEEAESDEAEQVNQIAVREYSDEEKQAMVDEFYNWAVERAEIGNMAVTDYYFGHGAAGRGDWYASTPDGEVLVQDQNNPGFDAFDIHAIGGIVFYQPISGDYGEDENTKVESTATGYQTMALDGTDIHKYMLADNGVVYEHISPKEVTTLHTGFGEYDDDGTPGEYAPASQFEVSGDQDAQNEWKRILSGYQ